METFVWLANPDTGQPWQCPVAAAEVWRAKGWRDCDPPPEDESHLRDQPAAEAEPEAKPELAPAESKTASRKRGGETTTAPEEG